jgi:hypothetical protein
MILIFKNFISNEDCNKLNKWVDLAIENKWLNKAVDINYKWEHEKRFTTRNNINSFQYPKTVYEIQEKIDKFLNIEDLSKSVFGGKDGIVVSCIFSGGDLHKHKDPKEGELEVLRCNIMTRSAENEGKLYIGKVKIDINVGDLHCYLPSTVEHHVTEVKGQTSRVLWMFSYQCTLENFNKICQHQQQT